MENNTPLQKYYRQPSIYIGLPSKGKYYSDSDFSAPQSGEIPVFPMTAKDEIAFKTPDGLVNGESTVSVIASCLPNIKDPWQLVNYDLDAVLIALRIATYGETMDITATVPGTGEQVTHTVNLPSVLEAIKTVEIKDTFTTKSGFVVRVSPLRYREINKMQQDTFEQQKIVASVQSSALSQDEKNQKFTDCFKRLTQLNFNVLENAVTEIKTPAGDTVTDKEQIKAFINNADAKTIKEIQDGVNATRSQAAIKPMKIQSTEEQIKKGAPVNYELPITFDNANFFV